VFLKKGESKRVTFILTEKELSFYNSALKFVAEPGEFTVFIGGSSVAVKTAEFSLLK
jgi:beta-glucosidase